MKNILYFINYIQTMMYVVRDNKFQKYLKGREHIKF